MYESPERFFIGPEAEKYGEGGNKEVFQDAVRPEMVVAKEKHEKEAKGQEARLCYWVIKLAHILLPNNRPDIHASFSRSNMRRMQKVNLGPIGEEMRQRELEGLGVGLHMARLEEDPRVQDLGRRLNDLGFAIDKSGRNFGVDDEGNAVYVDELFFGGYTQENVRYALPRLKEAAEKLTDEHARENAMICLDRINKLLVPVPVRILERAVKKSIKRLRRLYR